MTTDDEGPARRKGYSGPSIRYWKGMSGQRSIAYPAIDPARPVHVALASPWRNVMRTNRIDSIDRIRWDFPEDVVGGDTVITVVEARYPAIAAVSVAQTDNGDHNLETIQSFDGLGINALEKHLGEMFPIAPRTLATAMATRTMAAIDAEVLNPTSWWELPNACSGDDVRGAAASAGSWGCNACGRDRSGAGYCPRFQGHAESVESDGHSDEAFGVCPSCHDILHQPFGPTFDELMFSHRPTCPECHERRTFMLLSGMPIGPPPHGTVGLGCVVYSPPSEFRCGACYHEW